MLKKISVFTLGVAFIFLGFGCSRNEPLAPLDLSIGSYVGEAAGLLWIAEGKKFFEQNGLNLTIKESSAGKLQLEDVLAGKIDIASPAEFAFVAKSFDHTNLKIFTTTCLAANQKLIARKDKGILTPKDLVNRKIGTMKNTSAHFGLGSFLEINGIKMSEVEIVDLKPSQMLAAIDQGQVDAIIVWEPNLYRIEQALKDKLIVLSTTEIAPIFIALVSSQEVIDKKPEALKRFLTSMLQAEAFVVDHEAEAKKIIKSRIEADDAYMEYIWPKLHFSVSLPQALLTTLEDEAAWMIQQKPGEKIAVPKYLDVINLTLLQAVNPDAVKIIH